MTVCQPASSGPFRFGMESCSSCGPLTCSPPPSSIIEEDTQRSLTSPVCSTWLMKSLTIERSWPWAPPPTTLVHHPTRSTEVTITCTIIWRHQLHENKLLENRLHEKKLHHVSWRITCLPCKLSRLALLNCTLFPVSKFVFCSVCNRQLTKLTRLLSIHCYNILGKITGFFNTWLLAANWQNLPISYVSYTEQLQFGDLQNKQVVTYHCLRSLKIANRHCYSSTWSVSTIL